MSQYETMKNILLELEQMKEKLSKQDGIIRQLQEPLANSQKPHIIS